MNKKPIYVVSCTETDRDCSVIKNPVLMEVIGLFETNKKAVEEINRRLVEKKNKITGYYEELLKDVAEEINDNLVELSKESNPDNQEILRFTVGELIKKQQNYQAARIPEIFINKDNDGEISEITTRDDSLCWICAFDIQKMNINK